MTYNPKIKNKDKDTVEVTSNITANNINLGPADDDVYTDGLFKDFTNDTTVGVAIDKINEVLAGLAPSQAPELKNITSTNTSGKEEKLALDKAAADTGTLVEQKADANNNTSLDLAAVGNHSIFSKISGNGTNEYRRLGIYVAEEDLIFVLNGMTTEDSQNGVVNYSDNSFDASTSLDNENEISVFLNDSSTPLTQGDDYTITFTAKKGGKFPSGTAFDNFQHRTGTFILLAAGPNVSWREGHNFLRISHGDTTTSYVDWVMASSEASSQSYTVSLASLTETVADTKYVSGIEYATELTIGFGSLSEISNYAVQSYPSNYGVSIDSSDSAIAGKNATETSAQVVQLTDLDVENRKLNIENITLSSQTNKRMLSTTSNITVSAANVHGKSGTGLLATKNILLDTNSDGSRLDLVRDTTLEDFNGEAHRVTDETGVTWNSSAALVDGNAAVYNGRLIHPSIINVSNAQIPNATSGKDYSAFSQRAFYYRKYTLNAAILKIHLQFNHTSKDMWGTTNEVDKWHLEFLNGQGTWKDALKNGNGEIATDTLLNDSLSGDLKISFGTNGINPVAGTATGYFRISMPVDSSNWIETITTKDFNMT